jgi:hypothetical protein
MKITAFAPTQKYILEYMLGFRLHNVAYNKLILYILEHCKILLSIALKLEVGEIATERNFMNNET